MQTRRTFYGRSFTTGTALSFSIQPPIGGRWNDVLIDFRVRDEDSVVTPNLLALFCKQLGQVVAMNFADARFGRLYKIEFQHYPSLFNSQVDFVIQSIGADGQTFVNATAQGATEVFLTMEFEGTGADELEKKRSRKE